MGLFSPKMGSCCSATSSCITCSCAVTFQVFGIVVLAYDLHYFLDIATNNLAYCLLVFGISYLLLGTVAIFLASRGHNKGLLITYVVLLLILLAVEVPGGLMIKLDEGGAKEWFTSDCEADKSCSDSMREAEDKFDRNEDTFFFVLLSLIGFKAVAILLACCHNSVSVDKDSYHKIDVSEDL